MAGEWLKIRLDLHDDPAVIGIAAILGMDQDTVVGKLVRLWSWANGQLRNGNAASVTETWIDRYTNAAGFASAMEEVGWLVLHEHGVSFPKWDAHNSPSAKRRALANARVKRLRNAASVTEALQERYSNAREEEKIEEEERSPTPPKEEEDKREEENLPPTNPPSGQPKRKTKLDPAAMPIPAAIDTPSFREAWAAWVRFRSESRKKLTSIGAERQLAKLAGYGEALAIASIDQSILHGWQGLFAPRPERPAPGQQPARPTIEETLRRIRERQEGKHGLG